MLTFGDKMQAFPAMEFGPYVLFTLFLPCQDIVILCNLFNPGGTVFFSIGVGFGIARFFGFALLFSLA